MRLTIDHKEVPGVFKPSYHINCTVLFTEEEKAIINARGLRGYEVYTPTGGTTTLNPAETRRVYALKGAAAAGVSFLSLFFLGPASTRGFVAMIFVATAIYAAWCGFRWLKPKYEMVNSITLGTLITHKGFVVQVASPQDAKEAELSLEGAFALLKEDLLQNAELPTSKVHEF